MGRQTPGPGSRWAQDLGARPRGRLSGGRGGGTPSAASRGPRPQRSAPAAESSGSRHGVRPLRAPQSGAPAWPTCASAGPGPGPGLRQPDAAAAGLTRSPRLRRTRSSALGGGAQRSPRNPFVWLNRRDITRRPNRRLPGGGAAEPGCAGAPCRRPRALWEEVGAARISACEPRRVGIGEFECHLTARTLTLWHG